MRVALANHYPDSVGMLPPNRDQLASFDYRKVTCLSSRTAWVRIPYEVLQR